MHSLRKSIAWLGAGWAWEILSLLAGNLLLLSLALTLNAYNGTPAAKFGPAITLSTVVAIIGVLIQACFMYPLVECLGQLKWRWLMEVRPLRDVSLFESAGKGPLSALQLIYSLKGSQAVLAAVLLVLSPALSPLLQQLVSIQSSYDTVSTDAVPASRAWGYVGAGWQDGSMQVWAPGTNPASYVDTSAVPFAMKGAIQTGLFIDEPVLPLEPFCSSGNCTFVTYQSLAVCSSVIDVSDSVQHRYIPTTGRLDDGPELDWLGVEYYIGQHSLMPAPNWTFAGKVPVANISATTGGNDMFGSAFAHFMLLVAPNASFVVNATEQVERCMAFELMLQWCVQNYTTTIVNGIAHTEVIEVTRNFTLYGNTSEDWGDFETSKALYNHNLTDVYQVDGDATEALARFFRLLMRGFVLSELKGLYGFFVTSDPVQRLTAPYLQSKATTKAPLEAIFHKTAMVITNHIRATYNASGSNWFPPYAKEDTLVLDTLVIIRWYWIIGPVLIGALSTMLCVTVMLPTGKGLHLWKSSSRPLLHALEPELLKDLGGLGSNADLAAHDKTLVQLTRDDAAQWRLTRARSRATPFSAPLEEPHIVREEKPLMTIRATATY